MDINLATARYEGFIGSRLGFEWRTNPVQSAYEATLKKEGDIKRLLAAEELLKDSYRALVMHGNDASWKRVIVTATIDFRVRTDVKAWEDARLWDEATRAKNDQLLAAIGL